MRKCGLLATMGAVLAVALTIGGDFVENVVASHSNSVDVRVTARGTADGTGRVEFAIQQRLPNGEWSPRKTGSARFMTPALIAEGTWKNASPVQVEVPADHAFVTDPTPTPAPPLTETPAPGSTDCAPWVYCFSSRWDAITEWRESMRWQDPLPQPEPPTDWEHATWRFAPDGYRDRPFILRDDERISRLRAPELRDIGRIFARHQAVLKARAESLEWMNFDPLDGLLTGVRSSFARSEREAQREWNESRQTPPHVHEIVAIAYYPTSGRARVYEVYRNSSLVARDGTTGEVLGGLIPERIQPEGDVVVALTFWEREGDEWLLGTPFRSQPYSGTLPSSTGWPWSDDDPYGPYLRLWWAALQAESGE